LSQEINDTELINNKSKILTVFIIIIFNKV